ncbi:hypothetical protein OG467_39200 [Streptomyces sp. NBC_01361]
MSERKPYKTDLSNEQWSLVEPVITAWKAAHPSVSGQSTIRTWWPIRHCRPHPPTPCASSVSRHRGSTTCAPRWLRVLGIVDEAPGSSPRPRVRTCVDWTEQRLHLAGGVGAAVFRHAVEESWLVHAHDTRVVRLTDEAGALFACTRGCRHDTDRRLRSTRRTACRRSTTV